MSLSMKLSKLLLLLVLVSCNPYNKYSSPCVTTPGSWKGETVTNGRTLPCKWWEIFENPTLNELEEQALAHNREIEQAWYVFKEAVAVSRVARAQLFPQVNFDPAFNQASQLVYANALPGAPNAVRARARNYTMPLDAQYEVDVWNQLGLGFRSAALTADSLCWALQSLRVSITAQVAENFFTIRTLDTELDILRRSLTSRESQLHVTQARYDAGLVNYTDVSRAKTELTNVMADIADVTRIRITFVNALAVLTGKPAPDFTMGEHELQDTLPTVPTALPSELICNRPDIIQAERQVASAHADIGVAWASFLPSFSINGTLGYSSPFTSSLVDWKARLWGYAYEIAQVVFDGGAIFANYQASKDAYLQEIASYQQTILIAFQEVEDALANIEYRYRQEMNLILSIESSKDTLDLNNLLYEKGIINYLDVVDAERTNLDAQRLEARTRGAQFVATVGLIKALGGSW